MFISYWYNYKCEDTKFACSWKSTETNTTQQQRMFSVFGSMCTHMLPIDIKTFFSSIPKTVKVKFLLCYRIQPR